MTRRPTAGPGRGPRLAVAAYGPVACVWTCAGAAGYTPLTQAAPHGMADRITPALHGRHGCALEERL